MSSPYLRKNALVYDEDLLSHRSEAINRLSSRMKPTELATVSSKPSLTGISLAEITGTFSATSEAMQRMKKEMIAAAASVDWDKFTVKDLYYSQVTNKEEAAPTKKESKPLTASPFGEW